jgi:hypothetical protein
MSEYRIERVSNGWIVDGGKERSVRVDLDDLINAVTRPVYNAMSYLPEGYHLRVCLSIDDGQDTTPAPTWAMPDTLEYTPAEAEALDERWAARHAAMAERNAELQERIAELEADKTQAYEQLEHTKRQGEGWQGVAEEYTKRIAELEPQAELGRAVSELPRDSYLHRYGDRHGSQKWVFRDWDGADWDDHYADTPLAAIQAARGKAKEEGK